MSQTWECYSDASYYDLWAVRIAGERRWGWSYHMNRKEEAEGLCKRLNDMEWRIESLRAENDILVSGNAALIESLDAAVRQNAELRAELAELAKQSENWQNDNGDKDCKP